jgi:hypothetical protein
MNNPDHISKCLQTIFWVKILKFFYAIRIRQNLDPGWQQFGSGINIPDPQHCMELQNIVSTSFGTVRTNILNGDTNMYENVHFFV